LKSFVARAIVTIVEALLLADFTTVRGTSSTIVTQPSYGWLDLGEIEDVVLYTDCRETTNANLVFETSPAPIDGAFVTLIPQFALATGLRTDAVFSSFANVPVSRYLRWKLSGSSNPWDASFRIWVAAYGWS
jgi:hypothetical protein